MEINILKERDTPLLSRKRFTLEIIKEGPTPSRSEIRDAVAVKLKSDKNLTIIKHVYPRYGVQKARVIAHVYEKEADLKRYEDEGMLKKHEKPEAKKEAQDSGEAAAEKPAEAA